MVRIRIRIRKSEERIRGSGSVPKCHRSGTLLKNIYQRIFWWGKTFNFIKNQQCLHLNVQLLAVRNLGEEVADVVAWYGVYYLGEVVVGVGVGGGGRRRGRGQVGANLAREGRVMHA